MGGFAVVGIRIGYRGFPSSIVISGLNFGDVNVLGVDCRRSMGNVYGT